MAKLEAKAKEKRQLEKSRIRIEGSCTIQTEIRQIGFSVLANTPTRISVSAEYQMCAGVTNIHSRHVIPLSALVNRLFIYVRSRIKAEHTSSAFT